MKCVLPWEEELLKKLPLTKFLLVHYDLEKVTKQARAMVTIYGLNEN
jgi:ATP-dependent Zn protease